MTYGLDLQRAIYTALSALTTPVYDAVPDGAAMPYIVIGDILELADETHDHDGRELLVTIHIWSQYAGMAEVRTIGGDVIAALHRQELAVTGYAPVPLALEAFEVLRDPDGVTRHGVLRFRAWMRPA